MMKTMRWLIYCLIPLCLLGSCDDEIPVLPDATEEGKNTFGCLINGELIVPESRWLYPDTPQAWFNASGDTLVIRGYGQNNQSFTFYVAHPAVTGSSQAIDSLYYTAPGYRYALEATRVDGITFTRLDTTTGVVSGRFSFQLDSPAASSASPLLEVTLGRFDIHFDQVYNWEDSL